jgi:hypothetical protein
MVYTPSILPGEPDECRLDERAVNLDDDRDEYCDKIFKFASGKQGRLSLTSE